MYSFIYIHTHIFEGEKFYFWEKEIVTQPCNSIKVDKQLNFSASVISFTNSKHSIK